MFNFEERGRELEFLKTNIIKNIRTVTMKINIFKILKQYIRILFPLQSNAPLLIIFSISILAWCIQKKKIALDKNFFHYHVSSPLDIWNLEEFLLNCKNN